MEQKKLYWLLLAILLQFAAPKASAARIDYNGLLYEVNPDTHSVTVVACNQPVNSSCVIPSTISDGGTDYDVVSIAKRAFAHANLSSLTVPESITAVSDSAFADAHLGTLIWNAEQCADFCVKTPTWVYDEEYGAKYDKITHFYPFTDAQISSVVIGENVAKLPINFLTKSKGSINSLEWNAINCADFMMPYNAADFDLGAVTLLYLQGEPFKNKGISILTVGENVTRLPYGIYIENSLTHIEWNAISCAEFVYERPSAYELHGKDEGTLYAVPFNVSNLTSINFGDRVQSIPGLLCKGSKITELTIPASVTNIRGAAFANCKHLTSVAWNAVNCANFNTLVGEGFMSDPDMYNTYYVKEYPSLFTGSPVTTFRIGDNVAGLPASLLSGVKECGDISIPLSLSAIGANAFKDTKWLDKAADGIVYAGKVAYCYKGDQQSLTSIALRDDCIGVAEQAFGECHAVTSLSLNSGMENIGVGAFPITVSTLYLGANVTKIKNLGLRPSSIYCYGNQPAECDDKSFITYNATLHVSSAALAKYFSAPYWSKFFNIVGDLALVESISLDATELEMQVGESFTLRATFSPASVPDDLIQWTSSAPEVVSVTAQGEVTAKRYGEADITIAAGGVTATCHVMVLSPKITLENKQLAVKVGDKIQLNYVATPSPDSTGEKVTWKSSDNTTLSVSTEGLATALAVGKADIIATYLGVSDTCHVTIKEALPVISLDLHDVTIDVNSIVTIIPSTSPVEVEYLVSTNEPDVIMTRLTDNKVQLLGLRAGVAWVKVEATDGKAEPDSCLVTVTSDGADFIYNGLVYLMDNDTQSLTVTYKDANNSYAENYEGLTNVTIPATVTYNKLTYAVTTIGEGAFRNASLVSVDLPEGLKTIERLAFYKCAKLESIVIPATLQAVEPFNNCTALRQIIVDEANTTFDSRNNCNAIVETASNILVAGCMTTVIPSTVTSIGNDAFSGINTLREIEIPDGVTQIGSGAFYSCKALKEIDLPSTLVSIGRNSFRLCAGLSGMEIPNSVKTIGDYAISNCVNIKSVIIGSGLTSIGNNAFDGCKNLSTVKSLITEPQAVDYGNNIFNNVNKASCKLIVPKGKKLVYASTEPWNEFQSISEHGTGDLNNDDIVNAGDVSALYEIILSGSNDDGLGDLNGDGQVNAGDISLLYEIILGADQQ